MVSSATNPCPLGTVQVVVDPRLTALGVTSKNFLGVGIYQTVNVSAVLGFGLIARTLPWKR